MVITLKHKLCLDLPVGRQGCLVKSTWLFRLEMRWPSLNTFLNFISQNLFFHLEDRDTFAQGNPFYED